MQRLRVLIVLTGLVVSGLGLVTPSAAAVSTRSTSGGGAEAGRHEPPQLRREGRWLVDPQGRVVIVHGLNLVYKRKPYVPPNGPTGFTERDASWLARHGFNAARVGTLWAGLTPNGPGQADPAYLDQWQRVLDLLARKRIWIQLDMHQDQWHEQYGGEGVPDWAAARQLPFSLTPPVVAPFPTGYWTPEVSAMFDDFWANRRGLLDGWLAAWQVAAQRWKHQRVPDGLRPAQRALDGDRVADLPDHRLPRVVPHRAAAGHGGRADGRPGDRPRQHRLVGAAAVRRRPGGRHLLHRAREGGAARPLVAQLLPGGLPGEPGRARAPTCRAVARTPTAASGTRSSRPSGCTRCR